MVFLRRDGDCGGTSGVSDVKSSRRIESARLCETYSPNDGVGIVNGYGPYIGQGLDLSGT